MKFTEFYIRAKRKFLYAINLINAKPSLDYCPVCFCKNIHSSFIHKEWHKRCYTCERCDHSFLPDFNNKVPKKYFVTNKQRAELYAKIIAKIDVRSIVEIGTADDFYFLKYMHKIKPDMKLYGYDLFKKEGVPDFVEMIEDLSLINVDLIYASHVVEHFTDLDGFCETLKNKQSHFIIEVPNCPLRFTKRLKVNLHGTGYHYHFFNLKSMDFLLERHGIKSITFVRKDIVPKMAKRGSLVATNIDLPWDDYIYTDYEVIDRLNE